jgi:hypothetical protein
MYGVTEVFLGRYQGVVFAAFIHQILVSHNLQLMFVPIPHKISKL